MKVITRYKTTELIKLAHNEPKLIVCATEKEAFRIREKAEREGYNIHLPITYREFLERRYSFSNIKGLLIDNVDNFINYIARANVEAITIDEKLLQ